MTFLENRIPPPVVTLLTCIVMSVAAWATHTLELRGIPYKMIALILIATGLLLLAPAVAAFRRAKTTINPVQIERASTLVTTGIFRFTRNPMYLGMATVISGVAFALGNLWLLFGTIFFVTYTTWFQILPEERVMREKFGLQYHEYCQKVRRWV